MTVLSAVVDASGRLEPGAPTALVPWWSFTKTLLAASALRLVEQGRLTLDMPWNGAPYTLRDLLQHRAGIGNYGGMPVYEAAVASPSKPWSDDELLARVPSDRLLFPPKTGWAYSNVGYLLVRRLVEEAFGGDLRDVLDLLILKPLHLTGSRLAERPEDMADTVFPGGWTYHPGWTFHGVVIGPVAEAARAFHGVLQSPLLSPSSRAAMLEDHAIGGPIKGRPWVATGYGLGLMIGTMRSSHQADHLQVAGHSAGGPGSVGAVYRRRDGHCRTVAVFAAGSHEGMVEYRAARLLS